MNSDIDLIYSKIALENKSVIIYGADTDTLFILRALKSRHNVRPECLCDNDRNKWHKSLVDVKILPPDEATSKYPDAVYYIASRLYKSQIIGSLLHGSKINPGNILNYELIEKRKSCVFLESSIVCLIRTLDFCCSDFGKNASPHTVFNGDYGAAAQELIEYRDKLIDDVNHGLPTPCDGCPCLKEDWYARDRKIRQIIDGGKGVCNFHCCYCDYTKNHLSDVSNDINVQTLMDIFESRDVLADELQTIIGCGEVTIHPRRAEIYESIRKYRNSVCTNATIFDRDLQKLLDIGQTDLIVSVDAGTRDTFKKVKGVDLFDKIKENIKLYSDSGVVKLKYIFLPGLNDNKADVEGFAALCRDAGTELVQISYDLYAPPTLTENTKNMAVYLTNLLSQDGTAYKIISDTISRVVNQMKSQEIFGHE